MPNYLLEHPSINELDAIKNICLPLDLFNISSFANARVNEKGEFSTICNHPEFLLHYLDQGYHHADISAKNLPLDIGDYLMWDMLECQGKTDNMLSDAAEFNYRHIFTVIKKRQNYTDYYHFGTHKKSCAINQWYLNNLDKLHLFIDYFDDKISQSKTLLQGHKITFPVAKSDCQILDFNLTKQHEQQFLSQVRPSKNLTVRQQQCVKLLVQGYRAKEIAKQLNLSHRTVEDYLNVLKHKFNAKNKTELLIKLLE